MRKNLLWSLVGLISKHCGRPISFHGHSHRRPFCENESSPNDHLSIEILPPALFESGNLRFNFRFSHLLRQFREPTQNTLKIFFISRLFDITHGQRRDREMTLHLIFEHVHQDLSSYLEKCPPPGLTQESIKVSVQTWKKKKSRINSEIILSHSRTSSTWSATPRSKRASSSETFLNFAPR